MTTITKKNESHKLEENLTKFNGLISRIYKGFLQINKKKKASNYIFKLDKRF